MDADGSGIGSQMMYENLACKKVSRRVRRMLGYAIVLAVVKEDKIELTASLLQFVQVLFDKEDSM